MTTQNNPQHVQIWSQATGWCTCTAMPPTPFGLGVLLLQCLAWLR